MDKQIMAVILSFALYVLYVLLPMIPAVVIYKIFPDSKVAATGAFANLSFKTTGAFAAYVITVFLGYFIIQNTHHLIAQISHPVWILKAKVKLEDKDGTPYPDKKVLETLVVAIEPSLQDVKGCDVILSLPGSKKSWETTKLFFNVPKVGGRRLDLSEISQDAKINNYDLIMKLNKPIIITADKEYSPSSDEPLQPDTDTSGPKLSNPREGV